VAKTLTRVTPGFGVPTIDRSCPDSQCVHTGWPHRFQHGCRPDRHVSGYGDGALDMGALASRCRHVRFDSAVASGYGRRLRTRNAAATRWYFKSMSRRSRALSRDGAAGPLPLSSVWYGFFQKKLHLYLS